MLTSGILGVAVGIVMGLLLSVLGAGGSLFIVPVLIFLFKLPLGIATGTSLSVVFASALIGALGHARHGRVRYQVLIAFGFTAVVGAIFGAKLHQFASQEVAGRIFGIALSVAALKMWLGEIAEHSNDHQVHRYWSALFGLLVGTTTGFLGVGGGFLIVPVLIWGVKLRMHEAVGTSLAVMTLSSISGALTHAALGNMDLGIVATVGSGGVLGVLLGVPLSGRIPELLLRRSFAALAGLLAIYLLCYGWPQPLRA